MDSGFKSIFPKVIKNKYYVGERVKIISLLQLIECYSEAFEFFKFKKINKDIEDNDNKYYKFPATILNVAFHPMYKDKYIYHIKSDYDGTEFLIAEKGIELAN